MTLAAAVAPLAAYAVLFQTALYLSLPIRLRTRFVPLLAGCVGGLVTLGAGALFGFQQIGLLGADPVATLVWAAAAAQLMSLIGSTMMRREDLRAHLADPRLASLSPAEAFAQIFVRIPIFTALIEEAFFRGVLHATLIALYPTPIAIWLGAGLFGLWHIGAGIDQSRAGEKTVRASALHTVVTVVATTVAGAFFVWLRVATGSIWAPVAVHATINMTMALFARAAADRQ